ncbi:hypothetical protein [Sulfurihydrogenibium yellowstonense]|uniref:Uncharacterized protein n=1 Tax=Sulfurihydrogenibium yellowstonense SS-5 TaxID=432331 RepID=C4FI41_9AQUI|nr:hypothetical protein [Sulfurihydrogenibium yellowstonense]EEP61262.1 hypothetical protein SULYE_0225 [Sulfurihydrogenibium yellowstonense SS-5]
MDLTPLFTAIGLFISILVALILKDIKSSDSTTPSYSYDDSRRFYHLTNYSSDWYSDDNSDSSKSSSLISGSYDYLNSSSSDYLTDPAFACLPGNIYHDTICESSFSSSSFDDSFSSSWSFWDSSWDSSSSSSWDSWSSSSSSDW